MHGNEVLEFPLMPHSTISWLGASPDGITTNDEMIEIKVPLTREITGKIPLQYWMQMQIQMEVCDIDVCRFVEVKFEEYDTDEDYKKDFFINDDDEKEFYLDSEGNPKGTVIEIVRRIDGEYNTEYVYPPALEFESFKEEQDWIMDWFIERLNANRTLGYEWMFEKDVTFKCTHYKVIQFSDIKVKRDTKWFQDRKPELEEWWNKILKWRKEGVPPEYKQNITQNTYTKNDCEIYESDEEEPETPKPKKKKKNVVVLDLGISNKKYEVDNFKK